VGAGRESLTGSQAPVFKQDVRCLKISQLGYKSLVAIVAKTVFNLLYSCRLNGFNVIIVIRLQGS
jgi:hypothetical protein